MSGAPRTDLTSLRDSVGAAARHDACSGVHRVPSWTEARHPIWHQNFAVRAPVAVSDANGHEVIYEHPAQRLWAQAATAARCGRWTPAAACRWWRTAVRTEWWPSCTWSTAWTGGTGGRTRPLALCAGGQQRGCWTHRLLMHVVLKKCRKYMSTPIHGPHAIVFHL